jgi:hypothetical protein
MSPPKMLELNHISLAYYKFCFLYIHVFQLDSDMLCLYIDGGSLVVHLVSNNDDFITTIGDVQNGDWFKISIQFISGIYKLTCNYNFTSIKVYKAIYLLLVQKIIVTF